MPTTLADRLFLARNLLERRLGRKVTHRKLGEVIGQRLHRAPFSAATVSQWMSGKQPLSLSAALALAKLCGVDPGWLAFGAASRAPGPPGRTRKAVPLIDEYAGARPVASGGPKGRRPARHHPRRAATG